MYIFLPIIIRYRNLTKFIYLTEYSSTRCKLHYINLYVVLTGAGVAQSLQ